MQNYFSMNVKSHDTFQGVSLSFAIAEAMKEPTLVEAQSWLCDWEMERILNYVKRFPNQTYESCFKYLLGLITDTWNARAKNISDQDRINLILATQD